MLKNKLVTKSETAKRECSVDKVVCLVMPELCLRKIFHRVLLLNSNFPEKYFKIFKKKNVIEVPVNSTDLFQLNMIDRYLDHPNENFKNGE